MMNGVLTVFDLIWLSPGGGKVNTRDEDDRKSWQRKYSASQHLEAQSSVYIRNP